MRCDASFLPNLLQPSCFHGVAVSMNEEAAGIDGVMVAELLAEGATARLHPSKSCVMLTLASGPPSLMLDCDLMDSLVARGLVVLGCDDEYRLSTH